MVRIRKFAVSMLLCMAMTAQGGEAIQTSSGAAPAAPGTSWKHCANENGTCSFPDTRLVRYGTDDTYFELSLAGPVTCSNAVFGDPVPGADKWCSFQNDPPVPESWTYCGAEATADMCTFFGTRLVRLGVDGSYTYKTAYNMNRCTVSSFQGDPAVGVDKTCSYASDDLATASSEWTECAAEDQQCNVSGTGQVRYGAAATYTYKTVTGAFECSNTVFGDPIPNLDKSCSYLAHTAPAPGENWTVVDIGTLGGSGTTVADINDSGSIVGWSQLANGKQHAFLYQNGQIGDLGVLAGDNTSRAVAINNLGVVLGLSGTAVDDAYTTTRVFIAGNGGLNELAIPFAGRYVPKDINDSGDMLINYQSGTCSSICALVGRNDHSIIDLKSTIPPGVGIDNSGTIIANTGNSYAYTTLYNINDGSRRQIGGIAGAAVSVINISPSGWNNHGEVVGTYGAIPADGGPPTGFLYRGGVASDLRRVIPGEISFVAAINDDGDLIGNIGPRKNKVFFLYENSSKALITLNDLPVFKSGNWQLDDVVRINNGRQIIGYGINGSGRRRAILLKP
nr:hypothetical protein [uncultured Massilia sp.]